MQARLNLLSLIFLNLPSIVFCIFAWMFLATNTEDAISLAAVSYLVFKCARAIFFFSKLGAWKTLSQMQYLTQILYFGSMMFVWQMNEIWPYALAVSGVNFLRIILRLVYRRMIDRLKYTPAIDQNEQIYAAFEKLDFKRSLMKSFTNILIKNNLILALLPILFLPLSTSYPAFYIFIIFPVHYLLNTFLGFKALVNILDELSEEDRAKIMEEMSKSLEMSASPVQVTPLFPEQEAEMDLNNSNFSLKVEKVTKEELEEKLEEKKQKEEKVTEKEEPEVKDKVKSEATSATESAEQAKEKSEVNSDLDKDSESEKKSDSDKNSASDKNSDSDKK